MTAPTVVLLVFLLLVFDIAVTVSLCKQYERTGYAKGQKAVLADLRDINNRLAAEAANVPAGTNRCYPQDCDADCPGDGLPKTNLQVPMPPVKPPRTTDHGTLCECNACMWPQGRPVCDCAVPDPCYGNSRCVGRG